MGWRNWLVLVVHHLDGIAVLRYVPPCVNELFLLPLTLLNTCVEPTADTSLPTIPAGMYLFTCIYFRFADSDTVVAWAGR